jgi:ATP-dependent 26S proteasome regulatory subunit
MTEEVQEEIRRYLRARIALIVLVTVEEQRAIAVLDAVRQGRGDLITWDYADGFSSKEGNRLPDAADPVTALNKIRERVRQDTHRRDLYVLKDFHEFWSKDARVRRKLRNLAPELGSTASSLVVTSPVRTIPEELKDEAVIIEVPLPTEKELRKELDDLLAPQHIDVRLSPPGQARLVQAALGLTAAQAKRAFAKGIVKQNALDDLCIDTVLTEKKAVIRESQALEFYAAEETPDDVGGLDALKKWLTLRERAFGAEAAEYGLPAPKGLALIGIPGTGKSLTAKMIGGLWRLPLLRLDVGALFGSLVGESEERARRALRLAETVAPCVLWIDELEKGFATGDLDGGTSRRVFGTILTWMQEKTAPVFVVATANDVTALPTETLRRGRFDEIYFLDLPTEAERREIITVHLRKRRRDPAMFDIRRLAIECEGYTGAELEQAIIDAMYQAFADERDIRTEDIMAAIARTVPLSKSHREVIERLRSWLRDGRAQSASFAAASLAEQAQVRLELD